MQSMDISAVWIDGGCRDNSSRQAVRCLSAKALRERFDNGCALVNIGESNRCTTTHSTLTTQPVQEVIMAAPIITAEFLRSKYEYNADGGYFIFKTSSPGCKKGRKVGHLNQRGYISISINKVRFQAHRLIWLYVNGAFPLKSLDHINGIRHDNRIENLRECSQSENLQNQRKHTARKSSGLIGAVKKKGTSLWSSQITLMKVKRHLGYFKTEEDAHAAYVKAKRELHPFGQL